MLGVCHCFTIVCKTCFDFSRFLCTLFSSCHVLCFVISKRSGLSNTEDCWLEKGFLLLLWSNWDILLMKTTLNWSFLQHHCEVK